MKRLALLLAALLTAALLPASGHPVIPAPASLSEQPGELRLSSGAAFSVTGAQDGGELSEYVASLPFALREAPKGGVLTLRIGSESSILCRTCSNSGSKSIGYGTHPPLTSARSVVLSGPYHGSIPVIIWKNVIPIDHTSHAYGSTFAHTSSDSGAMYGSDPHFSDERDGARVTASPKSASLRRPYLSISTFSGLMSRWQTWSSWQYASAEISWRIMSMSLSPVIFPSEMRWLSEPFGQNSSTR